MNENNQGFQPGGYPQNPNPQNDMQVQMAVNAAMEEQKKKKRKKRLIVLAVIAVVIVGVIALAGSGSDSNEKTAGTDAAATTAAAVEAKDGTEEKKADGQIGDYVCVVKSAELCKDYAGKDAVKITYSFTNNAAEAESFDLALTDNVYQEGVGLEETFIDSDNDDFGLDVKIKPGTTKEVTKVYKLRDTVTQLEVEIGELISFDDTKITTTVDIAK